ncbi:hypothetical protein SAMN04487943_102464 [Gracilibacillus orientalis]|uniref:Nucleotidyltransferase domain-containing protein n=1 Tax=Gracilibacillus orientalis TaxID=334253 RepID=A0A1I4J4P7_9BACI|nr:nucleotidyltransferase [Gracilibacillus orientalis]SFL61530.1 hypothetical protein SAMN04487943_102464 [Gracilibacillus orientalis]
MVSVNAAFNYFLKNEVNLDHDKTTTARKSRDWLINRISKFPSEDTSFPKGYSEINIFFGSFARRTKIRELDDIDLMIGLSGEGAHYVAHNDYVEIIVDDNTNNLSSLCFDDTNALNSRKVINKYIGNLKNIENYKKAEMKRNKEAANLKLSSYEWNFDIVPCFITAKDTSDKNYYLIPNGEGNWKFTDPRIDRERTKSINQSNDGNVLNTIRIMKYWNKHAKMPTISSYLLETIILNYYSSNFNKASELVDLNIPNILSYISDSIHFAVQDPKNIQGNINELNSEDRTKIGEKANADYQIALEARSLESVNKHEESIRKWEKIFGSRFTVNV